MNFELTDEQKMIQRMVREFAEKRVKPVASTLDESGEFPWDLIRQAAQLGLMGIIVPEKHGGAGADTISYCIVEEELARVWASLGLIISANNSLSGQPILNFGTEEQKQKYLIPLARGEILGCYALTESGAGSDAANLQTRVVLEGNEWIINGQKAFITNGSVADICVLIARTGEERHRGLSAFIVECKTPGFLVSKNERKMGLHSSQTNQIILDNCRIPKENLLGQIGDGWKIAMATLNAGRINIAAQAIGIAQGAFEEALNYAQQRKQFGSAICDF